MPASRKIRAKRRTFLEGFIREPPFKKEPVERAGGKPLASAEHIEKKGIVKIKIRNTDQEKGGPFFSQKNRNNLD
jgi:hypothetical protein